MKKQVLCLFLCLLCLAALPSAALADGEPEREIVASGDWEYALLEDGSAEITGYTGGEEELTIPDTLDGHPVTAIGDAAFYGCYSLTSVTIPDGVAEIGMNPFIRCDALDSVIVSSDHPALEVVDGVLFSKADKRLICYPCVKTDDRYTIPEGIEIIGDYAFRACDSLTDVTIPDGVTSISDYAFNECGSLTSVTIPDGVTTIGYGAFPSAGA